MNPLHEPLTSPRHAGRAPDEIDGLLRAFYVAELPDPWPVLKSPPAEEAAAVVVRRPRPWVMMRSRLALAASIGLLLIGCWFLSGLRNERPLGNDGPMSDPQATRLQPFPPEKVKTRDGREVLMEGNVIQEIEAAPGPAGKPIPRKKPATLIIKVQEVP